MNEDDELATDLEAHRIAAERMAGDMHKRLGEMCERLIELGTMAGGLREILSRVDDKLLEEMMMLGMKRRNRTLLDQMNQPVRDEGEAGAE